MNEAPIPKDLQIAIKSLVESANPKQLQIAAAELTQNYRNGETNNAFKNELHRYAYLISRMPATYGALKSVLMRARKLFQGPKPQTLLDAGSGPGTALWAATETWGSLINATALEKDLNWSHLAKKLAAFSAPPLCASLDWQVSDLNETQQFPPHDLVVLSYCLGELSSSEDVLIKLWNATKQLLILIEPGTPQGFERIRQARESLINQRANILLPCPHENTCPISQGDWCHFSQRIPRSARHRQSKNGKLSYEDEKYSYLVFSRLPQISHKARIIRKPIKGKGHVILDLCSTEGLKRITLSKKQKSLYCLAKKTGWGEDWES